MNYDTATDRIDRLRKVAEMHAAEADVVIIGGASRERLAMQDWHRGRAKGLRAAAHIAGQEIASQVDVQHGGDGVPYVGATAVAVRLRQQADALLVDLARASRGERRRELAGEVSELIDAAVKFALAE